jgi:acetyl-CoA carboxylase biotin carboxyl carrier protein
MLDIKKIEKLMSLMKDYGLDIIQLESEKEKISLAKNAEHAFLFQKPEKDPKATIEIDKQASKQSEVKSHSVEPSLSDSFEAKNQVDLKQKKYEDLKVVKSPFVGTFYISPSPDADPFVQVGSKVRKGHVLCIVEAMKIMNEIESDYQGEVVEILIEDGKPVEFGTELFLIKN